jgi:hypothetical protein
MCCDELRWKEVFQAVQPLAVLFGAVMGLVWYGVSSAQLQWRFSKQGTFSLLPVSGLTLEVSSKVTGRMERSERHQQHIISILRQCR